LKKEDGIQLVKKAVVRRTFESPSTKKKRQKAPKLQRLITEERLRRKKVYKREKKAAWDRTRKAVETYNKFVNEWRKKKHSGKEAAAAVTPAPPSQAKQPAKGEKAPAAT